MRGATLPPPTSIGITSRSGVILVPDGVLTVSYEAIGLPGQTCPIEILAIPIGDIAARAAPFFLGSLFRTLPANGYYSGTSNMAPSDQTAVTGVYEVVVWSWSALSSGYGTIDIVNRKEIGVVATAPKSVMRARTPKPSNSPIATLPVTQTTSRSP
jgi:hypothetical protein